MFIYHFQKSSDNVALLAHQTMFPTCNGIKKQVLQNSKKKLKAQHLYTYPAFSYNFLLPLQSQKQNCLVP